jgi:hypothetical protein
MLHVSKSIGDQKTRPLAPLGDKQYQGQPPENASTFAPCIDWQPQRQLELVGKTKAAAVYKGRPPSIEAARVLAIQGWLGHRSITSTAIYTALEPNRFRDFWRD